MGTLNFDVLTLFPGILAGPLNESILKRAQDKGFLSVRTWNIRDFTGDKHRTADDSPYGGEAGRANSDPLVNFQNAADLALAETNSLTGREQFFAWFNRGTNLVYLQDFAGAAQAYDMAFSLYAALPQDERPWRLLWYQDGPYNAYYHTSRYQDVINLAHSTLVNVDKPVLEETYYWRGMAKEAMGDFAGAIEDLNRANTLNPNSTPAGAELQRISGSGG